jgi:hypothetical protein
MVIGFAAIFALGLSTTIVAPIAGGVGWLGFALFGFMVALSAATTLTIVWMTRLLETAERTIAQLYGDERRCLVLSQGERWTLPLGAEKLRVGQKIRVSFREIAPRSALEPGREVVEVRALED